MLICKLFIKTYVSLWLSSYISFILHRKAKQSQANRIELVQDSNPNRLDFYYNRVDLHHNRLD